MTQGRKFKRRLVTEELAGKITAGFFAPGSEFPVIQELMQSYQIGSRTASLVISDLGKMGLLSVGRGRRTLVRSRGDKPKFAKPIGIISPEMEVLQFCCWREWVLHHIQRRLLDDGNQALWLSEKFSEADQLADAYSGFIVAGERLPRERWQILQNTGLPCVQISFFRPHPDAVYIDYRAALDRVALYLGRQECRRAIHVASRESESKAAFQWFNEIGLIQTLQDYGVDSRGFYRAVVSVDKKINLDSIGAQIQMPGEKIAFLASNISYHALIVEAMRERRQQLGRDYHIAALSYAPGETASGCVVDIKCAEIVDALLEMFYERAITGRPQFSKIIAAEFHEHLS